MSSNPNIVTIQGKRIAVDDAPLARDTSSKRTKNTGPTTGDNILTSHACPACNFPNFDQSGLSLHLQRNDICRLHIINRSLNPMDSVTLPHHSLDFPTTNGQGDTDSEDEYRRTPDR